MRCGHKLALRSNLKHCAMGHSVVFEAYAGARLATMIVANPLRGRVWLRQWHRLRQARGPLMRARQGLPRLRVEKPPDF